MHDKCTMRVARLALAQLLWLLPVALPDSAGGDLQRALSLHDQGRAAEALPLYAAALAATPTLGAALLAPQAAAYEELGQLREAEAAAAEVPESERWRLEVAFALGWQRRGRVEEAIAAYRRAAAAEPEIGRVRMNLGLALRTQGRLDEAIESLQHAARLMEDSAAAHFHTGVSLKRLGGRSAEAAASFRSCLSLSPEHAEAAHLLAALDPPSSSSGASSDGSIPAQASEGYVRSVFDAAANGYDEHLQGKLKYRGPELLQNAVGSVLASSGAAMDPQQREGLALDLGCGTGLCGSWLRPLAGRLVGIDLSAPMVEKAEARGIYDELIVGDILTELRSMADSQTENYRGGNGLRASLVVAADVFVYLGRLHAVLAACRAVMQPGGLLAFTVEDCSASEAPSNGSTVTAAASRKRYPCTRLDEGSGVAVPSFCSGNERSEQHERCERDGLVLQSSGRFAHSREHVLDAAEQAGA